MGSQFVDLNADGQLDYVTATFDGSPHVAYGSAKGFAKPVRIKDANGKRVLIASIWDYDKKKHITVGRSFDSKKTPDERCISALAFDWDGDGDHDLLLGSYENGHLYRQMNEGSNKAPKFTGKNIPVMVDGKPFEIGSAKMTTPRLVDWDGDGDMDLLAGSFGDSYGQKAVGGGVYLARNVGEAGKPKFSAFETLIAPSKKGHKNPVRPDAGLYPEAVDYDGDGDLDLVVGGYSMWTPEPRELTDAETAKAKKLQDAFQRARSESMALMGKISSEVSAAAKELGAKGDELRKVSSKIRKKYREQQSALSKRSSKLKKQLDELIPSAQRKSFVWLYERM